MKKRILVTGGTGFIGANLVRRLVGEGYRPTLLLRKESNLWRVKDLTNSLDFLEAKLTDYDSLLKSLSKLKPDIIYHLAVYGAYQGTQKNVSETYTTNILGTVNLLDICSRLGFDYFVNTGSSSEYGIKNNPMKETDSLEPINHYGVTKVSGSLFCKVISLNTKLPIVTLRPFSPYGYFEEKKRFIPSVIVGAIKREQLNLSNPKYVRDFIFIDDLIDAYTYFLNGKKYYGEVFNIGSSHQISLGEVVKTIEKIIGYKIKVNWSKHSSNQMEPKVWQADISKSNKLLGWKPKTNMNLGLKKTVEWFKNSLNKYE